MNLRFWSKKKKESEISETELLQQQVNELQEHVLKMSEQLTKLSRHQVKTSKNMGEKVDYFQTVMSKQTERDELLNKNQQYEKQQTLLTETLIGMLDEMDHVSSGIKERDRVWYDMLDQWTRNLVSELKKVGIQELDVYGKGFNPQLAESMKTVSKEELDIPPSFAYQVVEVLKRGFVDNHGKLIRKAQVITVEEDLYEQGREE